MFRVCFGVHNMFWVFAWESRIYFGYLLWSLQYGIGICARGHIMVLGICLGVHNMFSIFAFESTTYFVG